MCFVKGATRKEMNMKTRIGLVGAGWRAQGYLKVIGKLGNRMEVSGIYVRSRERALQMEPTYPRKVDWNLHTFLEREHDFVMLLVPRECALFYLEKLLERGIPVLMETPPGDGIEQLRQCYALKRQYHGRIQVAEQYFLQPYHSAVQNVLVRGMIGEVSNMTISMMHDYHGISIMRKILGSGFQKCKIFGKAYNFPVFRHCGREGLDMLKGEVVSDKRKRADFVFENGKAGFFDFSGEQYFNYFRTRHINVQGECGEIYDTRLVIKGDGDFPLSGEIIRDELGQYSNLEGCGLRRLTWNGRTLYENLYYREAYLSDDEIAMAGILDGMMCYVRTGKEVYPLEEALQDTYLYLMMDRAIESGEEVEACAADWNADR